MKRNVSIILLFFMIVAIPLFAQDFFIKQKIHTDAFTMMGQKQPEQNEVQTIWMTNTGFAKIGEQNSLIFDYSKKTITSINHKDKTYTVTSLDQDAGGSEENAQMQQMMKSMMGDINVSITPTSEKKTINKWKCKKYQQSMTMMGMTINADIWAASELKPPASNYEKLLYASYLMMPGMKDHAEKMKSEFKKIKGMVVKSETTRDMMGKSVKSWTELIDYGEKKAPASVFQVPSGYKEKEQKMGMPH